MIVVKHRGSFNKTERFLKGVSRLNYRKILEKYAKEGVEALSSATPVDTGKTASSWGYEISIGKDTYAIHWTNDNVVDGVPIAIVLQYGHVTGTGGFVQGRDYINPAIKPVMDRIENDLWREVTKL